QLCPFFPHANLRTSYTHSLALHDALPIFWNRCPVINVSASVPYPRPRVPANNPIPSSKSPGGLVRMQWRACTSLHPDQPSRALRSEEHTSELQSRVELVCRLLLEKKKNSN